MGFLLRKNTDHTNPRVDYTITTCTTSTSEFSALQPIITIQQQAEGFTIKSIGLAYWQKDSISINICKNLEQKLTLLRHDRLQEGPKATQYLFD